MFINDDQISSDYLLNRPQHRNNLAQDLCVICRDGSEVGVGGEEPVVAVFFGECFDGCFAIDHGCDDLAFFGVLLLADDYEIAIADSGIDHGIAFDFEHVDIALADEGFRQGVDFFNVLICGDWDTGSDLAYERNVAGLLCCLLWFITWQVHFKGAPLYVLLEEAFFFKGLELVGDGGWGG